MKVRMVFERPSSEGGGRLTKILSPVADSPFQTFAKVEAAIEGIVSIANAISCEDGKLISIEEVKDESVD